MSQFYNSFMKNRVLFTLPATSCGPKSFALQCRYHKGQQAAGKLFQGPLCDCVFQKATFSSTCFSLHYLPFHDMQKKSGLKQ